MKRFLVHAIAVLVCALAFNYTFLTATAAPPAGAMLPEITLPIPTDPGSRSYLGLPSGDSFKIPQIKAEVVIVEIFSMYCPFCQSDAPHVKKLYQIIDNDPELKDRIKLIGIGAGNSSYEVKIFKKTYGIPFPLFADGDFSIHKVMGEVRTPYFIGIKIDDNRNHRIFYSRLGGVGEADQFLETILELSGLKKGGMEDKK